MIQISVTTIVICAIIIVAAFITPLINIFFRKVEDEESATDDSQLPCLSVLLTVQDNARELEQHLPAMLTQDYPAGFEVIVVVGKGEDDTDDVLKKLSATYPNLYTTFIPDSSRYMSRKKLAVTLGVKAARHEWILMTEASCQPASDQWLKTMARHCQEGTDMVIGYGNYNEDFEDISYSADGGLYAELVENGSFEYSPAERDGWGPGTSWKQIRPGHSLGTLQVRMDNPIHPNNPTYMRLLSKVYRHLQMLQTKNKHRFHLKVLLIHRNLWRPTFYLR